MDTYIGKIDLFLYEQKVSRPSQAYAKLHSAEQLLKKHSGDDIKILQSRETLRAEYSGIDKYGLFMIVAVRAYSIYTARRKMIDWLEVADTITYEICDLFKYDKNIEPVKQKMAL